MTVDSDGNRATRGSAPIEHVATRIVYSNPWLRVREDQIRRQDGSSGIYGVVEKPDFAVVIPLDRHRIWLVEQYRYPVRGRYWEFPQGSCETAPDTPAEEVARRELLEETGLSASSLEPLGRLHHGYGYSTQGMHVFLATGLVQGDREIAFGESDLVVRAFDLRAFRAMLTSGAITDASTLAAWALYLEHASAGEVL